MKDRRVKKAVAGMTNITDRHLDNLLTKKSNASPKLAKRLESATGIPREIWVFGGKDQRETAWRRFVKKFMA